jgi:hypothetical protein
MREKKVASGQREIVIQGDPTDRKSHSKSAGGS